MSIRGRSVFRRPVFWIIFMSFVLAVLFVFFGQKLGYASLIDSTRRSWYASVFFLSVIIAVLLYLFLTKEEERKKRQAIREAKWEARRALKRESKLKREATRRLKKKFYEALAIVKKSELYKKKSEYNYEVPWYLILGGAEKEQKSLLNHSGLEFPINIEYKEGGGDTEETFSWHFAEEGVFVSVPNKFVSLEKSTSQHPVWLMFLKLFKKERWRRPINGIIFTINASEIMKEDKNEVEEFAKVIREKLNEVSKTFSSKIPIYMIITGIEEISGFREFFDTLTPEEKREVFGITFEDNIDNISEMIIETKCSNLINNLDSETIKNMHQAWSSEEKKKLFYFVEEFSALLAISAHFASKIFSGTRYYAPLMLRGIYFSDISRGIESPLAMTTYGEKRLITGLFLPKLFDRIILSENQLVKVNDSYGKKFAFFWSIILLLFALGVTAVIYYWTVFLREDTKEIKRIGNTYAQYLHLKKDKKPKLTIKRKSKPIENTIIEIGRIGDKAGGDVSFNSGSAKLTAYAKMELEKISKQLKLLDESTKFKIIGYTDNIGEKEVNIELSLDRAKSVKTFLVQFGIKGERISVDGYGEEKPIATNDTVEGRSLNRRVEIYAYGKKIQRDDISYEEKYIIENQRTDLQKILRMLDALRSMSRKNGNKIEDEPWKPGFFEIAKRNNYVRKIYQDALKSLLLPRVTTIIEKNLLGKIGDRQALQDNLKAYLMLSDLKHRKSDFLEKYMLNRWGNELESSEIKRLNNHLSSLLKGGFQSVSLQKNIISRARRRLTSNAGVAGFIYNNLKEVAKRSKLKDIQFIEVLDAFPNALKGADYRIPGFYTKEGYEKFILIKAKTLIRHLMEQNWILGKKLDKDGGEIELDRIYSKILNLYFIDYRRYWSKALSSIELPKYKTSAELASQLELLSSSVSPIVLVLRLFREHTYLLTPKEKAEAAMKKKIDSGVTVGEFAGSIGSKIDRFQRLGTKTMKSFESDRMVYDMRNFFKPYHELLDDKGNVSRKFKIVLRHTERIYQQMLEVDTSADPKQSAFDIVSKKSTSFQKSFKIKSTLLPPKLLKWYNEALGNSWAYLTYMANGKIKQNYDKDIWDFYVDRIKNKFPLNFKSEDEIDIDDFKLFFQKDGMLDKFFTKQVLPFVEIDRQKGTYKMKNIDGSTVHINKEMVDSFINAKKIQRLFFGADGKDLHLKFMAKPRKLSNNIATMELSFENADMIYEHGPKDDAQFSWPGQSIGSLAKFTLYNVHSERVVKVRGGGDWSILRLLSKLYTRVAARKKLLVSYKKGSIMGSFEIHGSIAEIFSSKSPLKHFELKKQ